MIIEGVREVARALDNEVRISQLFVCQELSPGETAQTFVRRVVENGCQVINVSPAVFTKIAYREHPDGLLAVAGQPRWRLDDLQLSPCPLIVVATGLEKPGNVGAILRSVDAAGADGVIVCNGQTDLANPNVVRASLGTLFSVQVAQADSAETLQWLQQRNIRILAASPHAAVEYTEMDLRKPCAILIGTEHSGLSDEWLASAHAGIRIPMQGQADSLNVAMATAILLFEAVRQRR
jgi:TrmH family RNA methyltransferase